MESAENRLPLDKVNWKMAEDWAEEGGRKNPATKILTVLTIPQEDIADFGKYKVSHGMTGVRPACRGRGLGKLLKARMLLYIREKYPGVKYITTGNADCNAPMLEINRRLGFRRHLPMKVYKLKL